MVGERADAWMDLAAERGVEVRADVAQGLAARLPDGVLEQVIDNLVDNAVAAAGTVPPGIVPLVVVGAERADGRVRISVTDSGPGMGDDEKAHAFDRFWRSPTSEPGAGSGLGLAIVRRLVEAAAGEVRLEDRPDGPGLRAVVSLPRA